MSAHVCRHCGSSDIDVDAARGDAVCTGCGSVLEQHIIVSEVQFEENAHGGDSAVGQFVGADGRGGRVGAFSGSVRDSREATLRNAKKKLTWLGEKLRVNQHCVDTAFNFFRMALSSGLTRGRRSELVIGACLYITCRTEGTMHMLIDFSDVLLMDVCELGRTYMAISTALCINVPVMDPCVYVLRFAGKLELGEKTHDVSVTAARLMQRMKRDWLHTGRRPSGLCGAALLLAARLHGFNRSVHDIVAIVRVHHSTLRKRLSEFKNTPSSSLTLDEFMTVDLEEEVDPPSFVTSRRKDKERLAKLFNKDDENVSTELIVLRQEIDKQLDDRKQRLSTKWNQNDGDELDDASAFIEQAMLETIHSCAGDELSSTALASQSSSSPLSAANPTSPKATQPPSVSKTPHAKTNSLSEAITPRRAEVGLGICSSLLGLKNGDIGKPGDVSSSESVARVSVDNDACSQGEDDEDEDNELCLDGIDDSEIDSYIMSSREILFKSKLWLKLNADYLKEQQEKKRQAEEEERLEKEGRAVKRPRRRRKQRTVPSSGFRSAEEAIEKMLHDKKLSNKINYEVLRELGAGGSKATDAAQLQPPAGTETDAIDPVDRKTFGSGLSGVRTRGSGPSPSGASPCQLPSTSRARSSLTTSGRSRADLTDKACDNDADRNSIPPDTKPGLHPGDGTAAIKADADYDDEADDYDDEEAEGGDEIMSAAQLLQQHSDQYGYGADDCY